MKTILASTALLVPFLRWRCEIVDDSDYQQIERLKSGQYALIKSDDLSLLRSQAELGKATGRYSRIPIVAGLIELTVYWQSRSWRYSAETIEATEL
jgi:hypothetical protein